VKPRWRRLKKVSLAGSKVCSAANPLLNPLPHPQDVANPVNVENLGVMAPAVKAVAMVAVVAAEAKAVVVSAQNVAKAAANAPSVQTAEMPKAAPSVVNAAKAAVSRAATPKAALSVVNAVVAMAVANAAAKPATAPKVALKAAPNRAWMNRAAPKHPPSTPWMPMVTSPPAQRVVKADVAVAAVVSVQRQPVITRPTKTACNNWLHPRTHQPLWLKTANPRSLAKTVKP
jgi:hypothetical protein